MQRMQIDGDGGAASNPQASTSSHGIGGLSHQPQQWPMASGPSSGSFANISSPRMLSDQQRQQWPAGLFSSGIGQLPGTIVTNSRDSAPQSSLTNIHQHPEPCTPIGSPMKVSGAASASRGAGSSQGVGGMGSPSWFSPKSRVRYSDRFIPSRAATARLDFSALDWEVVADQVNKSAQDREVSCQ